MPTCRHLDRVVDAEVGEYALLRAIAMLTDPLVPVDRTATKWITPAPKAVVIGRELA